MKFSGTLGELPAKLVKTFILIEFRASPRFTEFTNLIEFAEKFTKVIEHVSKLTDFAEGGNRLPNLLETTRRLFCLGVVGGVG